MGGADNMPYSQHFWLYLILLIFVDISFQKHVFKPKTKLIPQKSRNLTSNGSLLSKLGGPVQVTINIDNLNIEQPGDVNIGGVIHLHNSTSQYRSAEQNTNTTRTNDKYWENFANETNLVTTDIKLEANENGRKNL